MSGQPVPSVSVDQVPPDAALIDVREDDEWAAGHAPDARHIPMGSVPESLPALHIDGSLYVICRSGGRSAQVVAYLQHAGIDAVNVDGGMGAWSRAGRPMVAESDDTTPRVI